MPRRPLPSFRLLLTGFEPFGGSAVNPSQEVIRRIASGPTDYRNIDLRTLVLPVDADRGPGLLLKVVTELNPHAVMCLGESGKARAITLERVFVNLADYRIADNAGVQLRNQPIAARGPAAYFSTLPLSAMHDAVRDAGIAVEFSLSAGAFLCNHVAYALLHELEMRRRSRRRDQRVPAGFVHLPRLPAQVRRDPTSPRMPLAPMLRAVEAMIAVLANHQAEGRRSWHRSDS